MYAELTGNRKKYRIKSLYGNILMLSLAQASTPKTAKGGKPLGGIRTKRETGMLRVGCLPDRF
jgi:hypothetical protein